MNENNIEIPVRELIQKSMKGQFTDTPYDTDDVIREIVKIKNEAYNSLEDLASSISSLEYVLIQLQNKKDIVVEI